MFYWWRPLNFAACMAHCTPDPISANLRAAVVGLNPFKLLLDSEDLNSCYCCQVCSPPLLLLSPSGGWGDILYYTIRARLQSLGLHPPFSFRTSLGLPCLSSHSAALQPPSSIDPTISSCTFPWRCNFQHINTRGWRALFLPCLQCHWSSLLLAHWLPIPIPNLSQQHYTAASFTYSSQLQYNTKTDTPQLPTPRETHLPTPPSTSVDVHLPFTFHHCPRVWLNGLRRSSEPQCTGREEHIHCLKTHTNHTCKHTETYTSTGIWPSSKQRKQKPQGGSVGRLIGILILKIN